MPVEVLLYMWLSKSVYLSRGYASMNMIRNLKGCSGYTILIDTLPSSTKLHRMQHINENKCFTLSYCALI